MGAGGRDFHVFNTVFRDNPGYEVVAFTAAQIPGIEWRRYPPSLAGHRYPHGIPIYPEKLLPEIVREQAVDEVVLAYSDLTYEELGHLLSLALSTGASFRIVGPRDTMLASYKPVIAVTAVKTGAGKSTLSRALVREIKSRQLAPVVVRHPMAYGDLEARKLIVIVEPEDLSKYPLTVEEREEFEPYLDLETPVLAGIDYGPVLREAERLGDVIVWDGGNNDWPFIRPDLWVVVADALRPGMEYSTFPGEVNVRMAEIAVITKASEAGEDNVKKVRENLTRINPRLEIAVADLVVNVDKPDLVEGRRVVVVEDSPTVTHGGAPYGAGYVAARKLGAKIIDPRPYATGVIKEMYRRYPHIGPVVPSTGYTREQLRSLEETLNSVPADAIVVASPARIESMLSLNKPVARVSYEIKVLEGPTPRDMIDRLLERHPVPEA
ncbi:GTPase [Pyrodictium occultum]|uniref:GTPase n=1 Tax=Pyrodictium occultum TaxID=2309 RepID=A0A0V8RXG6_PYROC|nr:cyclic 2,3-diphosphoglycerate synthase [Pyrodictium occultum]KSW12734.1 GTPase [Pyrodictium occultum]